MRHGTRIMTAAALCGLIWTSFSGTAEAALKNETRTPIESVSVQIQADVQADYDINEATAFITTDSSLYTIGAYSWDSTKKEYWEPGDVPKLQIEIHARSGYYFYKTTGAGKFQITGGTYSSVKRKNNDETLVLTVKLTPASGRLDISETVDWTGYPLGKAQWTAVPYAGAYELKLIKDGQIIQGVAKVNSLFYDFYPYMTQPGNYQFRVRAIPKDSAEEGYITPGDWAFSDQLDISSDEVCSLDGSKGTAGLTPSQLGWMKNDEGWWYRNGDGSYPANGWQQINGQWYLFGYDGYMLTGWQLKNGAYYYLDNNGAMQTGWLQDSRKWYYLEASGAMRTGWVSLDGNNYFFDSDGSRHAGWLLEGGRWYYLNPDSGIMVRNTHIGSFYIGADGVWQQ